MVDIRLRKSKNEQQTAPQDPDEELPRAKSIHTIMRNDGEEVKVSEIERKNIKKMFIKHEAD